MPRRPAPGAVNVAGHVQFHELLVQRVPVFVAHSRRVVIRGLARIRIDQASDKSEFLHAALELGDAVLRTHAGRLRQPANAPENIRKEPALLRDHVVALFDEPLRNFRGFLGHHHLIRPGRKELDVRADFFEQFEMRFPGVKSRLIQERDHFVVADRHFSAAVRSAVREYICLINVERIRRGQMTVDVNYH